MKLAYARLVWCAIFCSTGVVWAQVGPYFVPALPYEGRQPPGRSMGGISPVWADEVPSVLSNPASIAGIERVTVAMAGQVAFPSLSYRKATSGRSADPTFAQWLGPSFLGAAIPLRVLGQRMAMSATYDGPLVPEWDGTHAPTKTGVARDGSASSVSLGAALLLTRRVAVGAGVTRWFGGPRWELSYPASEQTGVVRQHYRGPGCASACRSAGRVLRSGLSSTCRTA
ncbi:MAG: hypothetical protein H5U38_04705 [Calditrichaeota bacterium]|nr:hypothetical protein [Calditrichota bacterium]